MLYSKIGSMTRLHLPLLCILLSVSQPLAPVAQAQDPACDDFERATLGTNWTRYGGSAAEIVNGSDLGSPDGLWCFAGWTADVFGVDQYSHSIISPSRPPEMLTQVFVRRRASDLARYAFHWNGDPGKSQWEIKYDGVPTAQTRILALQPAPPPAQGDSICIEVEGATIRGYHEGILILTATDTAPDAILTAGVAGVVSRAIQGSPATPPIPIFASWKGGTLVPGGGCAQSGVTLFAVRRGTDVALEWTGGAPPHNLERAVGLPIVWGPLASCVPGPLWTDAAVVPDGRFLLYRVKP